VNDQVRRRSGRFIPLGGEPDPLGVLVVLDSHDADPDESPEDSTLDCHVLHQVIQNIRQESRHRFRVDRLVGQSTAMKYVRSQVSVAAQTTCQVLIVGPSGTGRETLARAIHQGRGECAGPLIPLSCKLLDAELLQTTIIGFLRRCAELETEQPGALLLLEIDFLPRDAQGVLMGFLEFPQLELRTVATATQRLIELSRRDAFRIDLAHALSTLEIHLPGLGERPEDIPLLAQCLVEEANARGHKQLSGFTPDAIDELLAYTWPGNVDELAALVADCHAKADGPLITLADLPEKLKLAADAADYPRPKEERIVLDDFLAQIEAELIQRAIQQAKGNKAQAARLLGITRARLLRRIGQLGLAK
jgi:DNA-binding NtrC family response regulator